MKAYCISCEKEFDYLRLHLLSKSHQKNQIAYLKKLRKNEKI